MRALNYPSGHTLSKFLPWSNCEDFEIFIWSKGLIIPQGMTQKDLELRFERQIMPRLIEIWARGNSAGSYSLQPPIDGIFDYGFFDFEGHEIELYRPGELLNVFARERDTFFAAMFYADLPSNLRRSIFCDGIMSWFPIAYSEVNDEYIKIMDMGVSSSRFAWSGSVIRYIMTLPIQNFVEPEFLSRYINVSSGTCEWLQNNLSLLKEDALLQMIDDEQTEIEFGDFVIQAISTYGVEKLLPTPALSTWLQEGREPGLNEVDLKVFQEDVRVYPSKIISYESLNSYMHIDNGTIREDSLKFFNMDDKVVYREDKVLISALERAYQR